MQRFSFDFTSPLSLPLRLFRLGPASTWVEVGEDVLVIRFGRWRMATSLLNVVDVVVTGPYNPLTSLGPRMSLSDRGATFGTSPSRGVCITFRRPVPGIVPFGVVRHPGVTVTV